MGIDLIIYRARVGLHYRRHSNLKGLKPFTDFESILFLSMLLSRSGDIETNPGPTSSSEPSIDYSSGSSITDSASELSSALFQNYLSLVHYNVQSLLPKIDIIETELTNYDLLCFTETWLSPNVLDNDVLLTGFKAPIRYDRPNDAHGGVAVYIKESLYSKRRSDLEIRGVENIWIEVKLKHRSVLIGTFYRPPNSDVSILTDIEASIDLAFDSGIKDIIITGDFNFDYLKPTTRKKIDDITVQYNLHQIIEEATNFTEHSASLIDICLVSDPSNVILSGVGDPFISQNIRYHCPIYCFYNIQKAETNIIVKRKIWLYDRGNFDSLRNEINETNWEGLANTDINIYATNIANHIRTIAEKHIPNKDATIRTSDPPWLDSNIRKLIKKRRRLFNKAKRTKTNEDTNKYRRFRNKVTKCIRQSKKKHIDKLSEKLLASTLSSSDWWRTLKSFIKPHSASVIPPLNKDATIISSNVDKANVFNDYFISQCQLNDDNTPLPDMNIPNDIPVLENIVLTPDEVKDTLQSLKLGKASGPDGINNRVLKELAFELASPLCRLFNFSLSNSAVPTSWKEANVTPIFKKDDPSEVSNYRPISLLNTIGKVFEKLVHKHVYNFFSSNRVLSSLQSGFIPGDSTVNQLMSTYDVFCKALDDGKEVRSVFCDISKAFDRVWHKGLLLKLKCVGIRGSLLKWFSNYLLDRKQRVVIPGASSDWSSVTAGVPQGSILGPLLFLIFINDIVVDLDTNVRLFADDTSLYIIVDTPVNAALKLNSDLLKIHNWATRWLVTFNPSKSESLLISRKRSDIDHPPLVMNDQPILEVNCHKHLGLLFSSNGTWHDHINQITSKAWTRINVMRKLKFVLDRKSLQTIYFTFVRPILEYSDIIWDNCTQYEKDELDKIQLEAARIVSGTTKLVSSASLYMELGWESLSSRRRKHKLVMFYKMINGLCPDYLAEMVPERVSQISSYNLRNSDDYLTIRTSSQLYFNSFLPSVVREWNALPQVCRDAISLESFKRSLNIEPTRKPPYYFIGDRYSQINHVRLRTHCSALKEHLFAKNIVADPYCSCGAVENNKHFLLECPAFNDIRQDMLNEIISVTNPTVDILLFGNTALNDEANSFIFRSVQKFILRSKRFKTKQSENNED